MIGRRCTPRGRRLAHALALLACAAALACGERSSKKPLSVVLVTMDTTRADALSPFGGRPEVTPAIDRLAAECVLYDVARSVAPLTLPSHASMLTGLYPTRHTIRDNGLRPLPSSATTLAERARDAGFATAAFVSGVVLERGWGIAQGFDVYDEPAFDPSRTTVQIQDRAASETVEQALGWLATRNRDVPFFLWVHFFDPHSPYRAPETFVKQANSDPYLAEVAAMDHAIGMLVERLKSEGVLDRSLLILVADHGESLGQHGEPSHSVFCYESTIRVPMLVRHPNAWRAGEHTNEVTSVVDVYPTALEAMGLAPERDIDGTSLMRARVPEDRGVYFESFCGYLNFGWSPIAGFADRHGKYIHSAVPELYDIGQDPREKQNLAQDAGAEIERYRERIAAVERGRALASTDGAVDDAMRARIQGLGYAGAGDPDAVLPSALAPSDRPSPRDRRKELRDYYRATLLGNEGDRPQAITLLQEIVRENPANGAALEMLGAFLLMEARYAECVEVLQQVLDSGNERLTTQTSLGQCFERMRQFSKALAHYQRALELKPDGPEQMKDVIRLLERLDRKSEAEPLKLRLQGG